jgi:hypothetical protein
VDRITVVKQGRAARGRLDPTTLKGSTVLGRDRIDLDSRYGPVVVRTYWAFPW